MYHMPDEEGRGWRGLEETECELWPVATVRLTPNVAILEQHTTSTTAMRTQDRRPPIPTLSGYMGTGSLYD